MIKSFLNFINEDMEDSAKDKEMEKEIKDMEKKMDDDTLNMERHVRDREKEMSDEIDNEIETLQKAKKRKNLGLG